MTLGELIRDVPRVRRAARPSRDGQRSARVKGRRRGDVIQDHEGWVRTPDDIQPGDYWKVVKRDGIEWLCVVPSGWMGNLTDHEIEEHEDGTITVSPSILTSSPEPSPRHWHGYLRRGVFSEV